MDDVFEVPDSLVERLPRPPPVEIPEYDDGQIQTDQQMIRVQLEVIEGQVSMIASVFIPVIISAYEPILGVKRSKLPPCFFSQCFAVLMRSPLISDLQFQIFRVLPQMIVFRFYAMFQTLFYGFLNGFVVASTLEQPDRSQEITSREIIRPPSEESGVP